MQVKTGEGITESQAEHWEKKLIANVLCQVRMNGQKEAEIGDSQSY